jgi:hypothetical protein
MTAYLALLFFRVGVFSPFAVSRDDIARHVWLVMSQHPFFPSVIPTRTGKMGLEKNKQTTSRCHNIAHLKHSLFVFIDHRTLCFVTESPARNVAEP